MPVYLARPFSASPIFTLSLIMILTTHPALKEIRSKVESKERLSLDDGILLYDPQIPVNDIGQLANIVRERINGNVGYYNIYKNISITFSIYKLSDIGLVY